jgi:hypothetical protein
MHCTPHALLNAAEPSINRTEVSACLITAVIFVHKKPARTCHVLTSTWHPNLTAKLRFLIVISSATLPLDLSCDMCRDKLTELITTPLHPALKNQTYLYMQTQSTQKTVASHQEQEEKVIHALVTHARRIMEKCNSEHEE